MSVHTLYAYVCVDVCVYVCVSVHVCMCVFVCVFLCAFVYVKRGALVLCMQVYVWHVQVCSLCGK